MKATDEIKRLIKEWEGCRLTAYRCASGRLTIGYGHTGKEVCRGLRIAQATAEYFFENDVARFEREVTALLESSGVKVRQHQFDALVSFAFNAGTGNLKSSTLLRKVKANPDDATIPDEFRRWVYGTVDGKKKVLPGLVKRRDKEARIYAGK